MKIERVFVLRFEDGGRMPYGVPEFLSEDEAADFLAHVQDELSDGAAAYFASCCQEAPGPRRRLAGQAEDGDDGGAERSRDLRFGRDPSERVRRLEARAELLRKEGLRSFAIKAERQVALEAAAMRKLQLEARTGPKPTRGKER